ncbi:MAG: guanylate kinase [Bacteroidota bacterium]
MSSDFLGKSIIVSAPSGAGKTTLVRHLLSERTDLCFSISATNRPKRKGEEDGKDYYFLSDEEFKSRIRNNEFLEWEEVYEGRFYGTLNQEVERIWSKNKHVVFDVDVIGGLHLKKKMGDCALAIFVSPGHMDVLEERLRKRETEKEEEILMRLDKAEEEMKTASQFDYILINDALDKAKNELMELTKNFVSNA